MDEAGDGFSTPRGDRDSNGRTPRWVSPDLVLETFRSEGTGPAQVTPEIRSLAQLLTPQTRAKLSEQLALGSDAFYGWRLLRNALLVQLPAMQKELREALSEVRATQPERVNEPLVTEPVLAASFGEYRTLRDMLDGLRLEREPNLSGQGCSKTLPTGPLSACTSSRR